MRSAGDLTTRATIRDEALRLFAEHGPDAVTIRRIAAAARVSPALVLHHFGSKAGLRAAVDEHAGHVFDSLLDGDSGDSGDSTDIAELAGALGEGHGGSIADAFGRGLPPGSPLPAYLRRLLLSGDPAGVALFRRWHAGTVALLDTMQQGDLVAPSEDQPLRAAQLLVHDLGLLLLRDAVADAIGVDPLSPAGLRRWADGVARLYRGALWPTDRKETPL